ncbi:MAG: cyclic nucleotide-binding domain-containing protein [Hyphomicrobiales bacterium]|nr:cyclic nucleotide-binding domain-containing protein [Hyphomicrobiales bacterium]
MKPITFKAGETIVREGEEGDSGFLIATGSVEVLIGEVARRVGTLEAGEVFGEMCLIDPGPRSATVRALTDVECLETSYQEFLKSIEEHPDEALAFMKTLVQRLRQTNQLIETIDPNRRGLRRFIHESLKSVDYSDRDSAWMAALVG